MAATFFCPFCGRESPDDENTCPRCGKSLEHWRDSPFDEKLLLTLHHPICEHRMMSIQLLGHRKYQKAVPVFASMIETEKDVYALREIAFALARIDTPESRRVLEQLKEHSSPVIHEAIGQIRPSRKRL